MEVRSFLGGGKGQHIPGEAWMRRGLTLRKVLLVSALSVVLAFAVLATCQVSRQSELDNMLAQASVSLRSAIGRTESRGAHAREDFPKRDDEHWLKHSFCWLGDDGRVRLDYRPVHLQTLSNDVATIPPKERVY